MNNAIHNCMNKVFPGLVFLLCLLCFVSEVRADESDISLQVDVGIHNKESVLAKEGCPIYSAEPIDFTIVNEGLSKMFYSISVDGGNNFGRYVKMTENTVTLYPDESICPEGVFKLKFKGVVYPGETEDAENEAGVTETEKVFESDIYTVIFDYEVPRLSVKDESVLNRRLSETEMLTLNAKKDKGYISRILACSEFGVIFEKCFKASDNVKEYEFCIPLMPVMGPWGQQISVSVEDEAQNVNETVYTYYFESTSDAAWDNAAVEPESGGTTPESDSTTSTTDVTPPTVSVYGIEDNANVRGPCEMEIEVYEDNYEGGSVCVNLTRSSLGKSSVVPVENYSLMAINDKRKITLLRDGDYIMNITARDGAGNEATVTKVFRIDSTAPDIKIAGINDLNAVGAEDEVSVCVREMFFDTAAVNVLIAKKDVHGEYECVRVNDYNMREASDCFNVAKLPEGEYKITVCAADVCGNVARAEHDFTVDLTAPLIGDLSDIDGKYLDAFSIKGDIINSVKDNTKVRVTALLNDSEITENDVFIGEGKYRLRVSAYDAAGNFSSRKATFVIDHTPPQIVISGVDSEGNIKKGSNLEISLFDDSDTLESVSFSGKKIAIKDNKAKICVDDYGDYKLCVKGIDNAGNVIDKEINSSCVLEGNNLSQYVKFEEKTKTNIVENDKIDKDFLNLVIGLITVLSGTYGLTFRAFAGD